MNIIENLKINIENFSTGQKKIAQYILLHKEMITELSSQILAQKIGVSQSSIIKFIQSLGFDGFTQFKLQLVSDRARITINDTQERLLHNQIERSDSYEVVAEKLLLEKQQALIQTTASVNFQVLNKLVHKMVKAQRIQIIGIGNSALTAKDLAYKLQKLGLAVTAEADTHIQLAIVQSLKKSDLLIAISYTGKHKEICLSAQTAKNNGVPVYAITSLQQSPLRKIADHILDTVADEVHSRSSSISSRTAQNTISDLIFMGVIKLIGEDAEKSIKNSANMIKQLQDK
ncbi:MurR/RpiR family transcriptional regulator [Orbus wheelerorum]|uniref:MurR/RpiR family transcriptional regulator n=1 Tax=Orbus wheelerorum TaxID=3074111 RepID=UPI00370DE065